MRRPKPLGLIIMLTALLNGGIAAAEDAKIHVEAGKVLFRLSDYMTGANLEDLNYQLSGGIYSQLIHGESFEEPFSSEGISQQWHPVRRGAAKGKFTRVLKGTFNGKQSQRVTLAEGAGQIGINNAGLNRWGINLVKGKPYEGLIRVRTAAPAEVHVSLRSADGKKILARKALKTRGDANAYQRFEFTLTPKSSDQKGRFAVCLRAAGSMTVGYVFLQPAAWGRYKGLPLRKDLVEAIVDQGVKVIRFNGSMIHARGYKWKNMIGPRDRRPPYQGSFNPYASNGFGIIDFLNLCEAADILPIPGLTTRETPQDLADFVEYVNGPADSRWGKKRAADGHPRPYKLGFIQFGNEEKINAEYVRCFKAAAKAIWAKDPNITLVVSDWMYPSGISDPNNIRGARCRNLSGHVQIIKFCREQKGKLWWDVHVLETSPRLIRHPNSGLPGIRDLKRHLAKLCPGSDLKIAVLEQNAGNHDVRRALGHALMKNQLERMGDYVPAVAAPNAFQPWRQYTTRQWDQGMIFYTPAKVWFQPAWYVDRMITQNWAHNVVRVDYAGPRDILDVTAKKSDDGKRLTLQVVNIGADPVTAEITIRGFAPARAAARVEEIKGDRLGDANTLEAPEKVKTVRRQWKHGLKAGQARYTFPGYSFTVLVLE